VVNITDTIHEEEVDEEGVGYNLCWGIQHLLVLSIQEEDKETG